VGGLRRHPGSRGKPAGQVDLAFLGEAPIAQRLWAWHRRKCTRRRGRSPAGPVKMMLDDARGYERFAAHYIDNYHYKLSRPL
jgi:hypothetical protein